MKKLGLLLAMHCFFATGMDKPVADPARGQKRSAAQADISESTFLSADSQSALSELPYELQEKIIKSLMISSESNNDTLQSAAKNIRSLFQTNKQFRLFASSNPRIMTYVIFSLAGSKGWQDVVNAVFALGIREGFSWLKSFFSTNNLDIGKADVTEITEPYASLADNLQKAVRHDRLDMYQLIINSFMPFISKVDASRSKDVAYYWWPQVLAEVIENNKDVFFNVLLNNEKIKQIIKETFKNSNNDEAERGIKLLAPSLLKVISQGNAYYFEQLLLLGLKLDRIEDIELPLFVYAALKGDNQVVLKKLFELDPKLVNKKIQYPVRTPLMEAVLKGDANLVKFLLEQGAKVNEINNLGDSALSLAEGKQDIIKLLKEHGAK